MKWIALVILFFLASAAIAQDIAKPPVTVQMEVSAQDVEIYARAIALVSKLCGAENPDACQIGLSAPAENAKLKAAMDAVQEKAKKK